jgi:hypothetical protein
VTKARATAHADITRSRVPHEVRLLMSVLLAGVPPCSFGSRTG